MDGRVVEKFCHDVALGGFDDHTHERGVCRLGGKPREKKGEDESEGKGESMHICHKKIYKAKLVYTEQTAKW